MSKWIFLSYELDDTAFGYGNGERLTHHHISNISNGDSSNNSRIETPTHYGTHIDFPFHFSENGKHSSDFKAENFIHTTVGILDISHQKIEDYLIREEHLDCSNINTDISLLFIKTGFCYHRTEERYWNYNWGFHHTTAKYLKRHFPNLKCIAFDLISLSSYQQRPEGRIAHKSYLCNEEILIVEDVDLQNISSNTNFEQVIISPLRIKKVDGTPVTIMAKII